MANRQGLISIRSGIRSRVTSSSSSPSSSKSRFVHPSAPSRATLQVAATLPMAEPQEITLTPIFDIFDAPSRLGESSELVRSIIQTQRSQEVPPLMEFVSSLPRPPPATLPTPIIFDGPARPRNLPLAFRRRVEQALSSAPSPTRHTRRHHAPAAPHSASEPLIEIFEGPARLRRYSRKSSSRQGMGKQFLFLGLAGAVGGAVLLNHDNLPMRSFNSNLKR